MRRFQIAVMIVLTGLFLTPVTHAGWRDKKIEGSGNVVTEEREISGVDAVELATIGRMFIEIGDEEKLVIEAEDNVIEYFDANVFGGRLTVDIKGDVNLTLNEPVRYYLTVKELSEIEISSSGDIEAPDLEAERFYVSIGSSGDLDMGNLTCSSLDIRIKSSGDVSLRDIKAKHVEVNINSSGDVRLETLNGDFLVVDINSSGNVRIDGGYVEEQDVSISSSGDYRAKRLESKKVYVSSNSSGDAEVYATDELRARLNSSGDVYYAGSPSVREREGSSGKVRKIR